MGVIIVNLSQSDADVNRRRYLKSMAVVGGAGLFAGCTGDDDPDPADDDADPADDDADPADDTDPADDPAVEEGGTLIGRTPEELETFDPRMNTLLWYSGAAHYIFDSLLMQTPDGEDFVPHVAAEPLEEVDETTYVAQLRDDVYFHNGDQLTAEDVAYSYNWVLDPDNASPNLANLEWMDTAEATGEFEVTLHLDSVFPQMRATLAGMNAAIVPRDAAEEMGQEEFGQNPIGSGPFELADHDPGTAVEMTAFDDYFLGEPLLDGVTYRPIPEDEVAFVELATGGIHQTSISQVLLDEAQADDNINTVSMTAFDYNGFAFNCLDGPFTDVRAREAIHYLVDYEEVMQAAVGELGSRNAGYMPQEVCDAWDFPVEEWWDEYYPEQDHDRAVELLEEAGLGTDFEVEIATLSSDQWVGQSIQLQAELEAIGVDAQIRELSVGGWLDRLDNGDHDIIIYGWGGGDDPDGYYYYMFRDLENDDGGMDDDVVGHSSAGYIHEASRGTDTEDRLQQLDENVRAARQTVDRDERYDLYVESAEIVQDLYIGLPVYAEENVTGVHSSVQDYELTAYSDQEAYNHWQAAWIDE